MKNRGISQIASVIVLASLCVQITAGQPQSFRQRVAGAGRRAYEATTTKAKQAGQSAITRGSQLLERGKQLLTKEQMEQAQEAAKRAYATTIEKTKQATRAAIAQGKQIIESGKQLLTNEQAIKRINQELNIIQAGVQAAEKKIRGQVLTASEKQALAVLAKHAGILAALVAVVTGIAVGTYFVTRKREALPPLSAVTWEGEPPSMEEALKAPRPDPLPRELTPSEKKVAEHLEKILQEHKPPTSTGAVGTPVFAKQPSAPTPAAARIVKEELTPSEKKVAEHLERILQEHQAQIKPPTPIGAARVMEAPEPMKGPLEPAGEVISREGITRHKAPAGKQAARVVSPASRPRRPLPAIPTSPAKRPLSLKEIEQARKKLKTTEIPEKKAEPTLLEQIGSRIQLKPVPPKTPTAKTTPFDPAMSMVEKAQQREAEPATEEEGENGDWD